MPENKIAIFGNGEIAEMADFYFSSDSEYQPEFFVIDDKFVKENKFMGKDIIPLSEYLRDKPENRKKIHVAISFSQVNENRKRIFNLLKKDNCNFVSYISSRAYVCKEVKIGNNCFILDGNNLQPYTSYGDNVMLWSGNHIGHRTRIGSHSYVSSHVCLSGFCKIGEANFFGVNSCMADYSETGYGCIIAMGAKVSGKIGDKSVIYTDSKMKIIDNEKSYERIAKSLTN